LSYGRKDSKIKIPQNWLKFNQNSSIIWGTRLR